MAEFRKALPVDLRSLGLDEKWLQDRIVEDPTILGLGELEVAGREHRQPIGGRIDFLMRDVDADTFYEVEVMLGTLDESHIVRAIEYWDIERQRRPQFEHRAVIVAENITGRFFNIVRLLNRAVPIIAIKLSAFKFEGTVVLHPVTVLDVIEEADIVDVDPVERADRAYWEKKANPQFLAVVDRVVAALRDAGLAPRLTYNRHHIALGTTGYNFCWFHPRKSIGHCRIEFKTPPAGRDTVLANLQSNGVDASPQRAEVIAFNLTVDTLNAHVTLISGVLRDAEMESRA